MNSLDDNTLNAIDGGTTSITGTLVQALIDGVKTIFDVGKSLGFSIRRISGRNLCPMP